MKSIRRSLIMSGCLSSLLLLGVASGCGSSPNESSQAQLQNNRGPGARDGEDNQPVAVDVAVAEMGSLRPALEYTGTTAPIREVLLRSQVEGRLLSLGVDIGDVVSQGQKVGHQDDAVLQAAVLEAQAEVAAQEAEVAQAITEVNAAKTLVEQSRIQLQQAKIDAKRLQELAASGASTTQQAELAQTEAETAEQVLRSAQEQVRSRQNQVVAAQQRVAAQKAVLAQEQEQLSYTNLIAPVGGYVLEQIAETGNLMRPGDEVIRIGDFSEVKVVVQVSELELSQIRVNQPVTVRLDAYADRPIAGKVNRISPAADPTSRLVPVEITIANNPAQPIGSGLLARVSFADTANRKVVLPLSALEVSEAPGDRANRSGNPNRQPDPAKPTVNADNNDSVMAQVFVLVESSEEPTVIAKQVQVGDRGDGRVEILSGLELNERYVVRSAKPLKDGDRVVLSAISQEG
jgi:HlyD family secretion protein